MKKNFKYYIDLITYKNNKLENYIFIKGWCFHTSNKKIEFSLKINDIIYNNFKLHNRLDLSNVYPEETDGSDAGFSIKVNSLPKVLNTVELWATSSGESLRLLKLGEKDLNSIMQKTTINYCIDSYEEPGPNHPMTTLSGWAYSPYGDISYEIYDELGKNVEIVLQMSKRIDLVKNEIVPEEKSICGFHIAFKAEEHKKYFLSLKAKDEFEKIEINKNILSLNANQSLLKAINLQNIKKALIYTKKYGVKNLLIKVASKFEDKEDGGNIDYNDWAKMFDLSKEQLRNQKTTTFALMPTMSLVVATYNTPIRYLKEMVDTVISQSYQYWELCIADGSTNNQVLDYINKNYQNEKRIKIKKLDKNYGISENMNAAIDMASGDFIGFYDHDDTLTPNALFEFVKAYNSNPKLEVIYSDEDKIDSEGVKRFEPHFKPDFNIDLLCSSNYICHLLFVKSTLIEKVGKFRSEYDGAQDHDFILRCVENLNKDNIYHIPKVLYHWRIHENSTSENPESKLYAFEAGIKASQDYFDRKGIKVKVESGPLLGCYRVRYHLDKEPKVSILIPNKDHIDDLKRCLTSIYDKTIYKNFEIIIIENNSEDEETFKYYDSIEEKYNNLRVVYWKNKFNYSAINNYGATFADGEFLLLLNNDTEVINPDWLTEMVGYCNRDDVGIVGARLYYHDDTVQHAGVIVGLGGVAGHCFVNFPRDSFGYFRYLVCARDYSAVTAACLLVKKNIFDQVNGLDEKFEVAFNDIDFCLKVRKLGYLVVYNPYVELYHYESKSRGMENSVEKVIRFNNEIDRFKEKWKDILLKGDPYYNPNLTLAKNDFSLKSKEEILNEKDCKDTK